MRVVTVVDVKITEKSKDSVKNNKTVCEKDGTINLEYWRNLPVAGKFDLPFL